MHTAICGLLREGGGSYLHNGVLASVVKLLGHLCPAGVVLGVGSGLDTLVLLRVAIPLACCQLELTSGAIVCLPR